jgi:TldD protein
MALLDLGLISRLLGRALAHGGEHAEVYVQSRRALGVEIEDGELKSASAQRELGVGIRVVRGAAIAYAYSDDTSDDALLECADAASRVGGDDEVRVVARPLKPRQRAHHADPRLLPSALEIDARAALLKRADASVRADAKGGALGSVGFGERGAGVIERVLGMYADVDEEVLIAASDGMLVTDQRALCRLGLEVIVRDKDGTRRTGTGGGGSRLGPSHFDSERTPEQIGAEAVRMARAQLGATQAPVGEQIVVVGPASSGVLLHEAVGHGLEADFIRKKTSLFAGRMGQKVASELCTVVDDGTLPGRRGSLNVDDEGNSTQRTVLIERGVLTGYMTDALNAQQLGLERTGNGRRQSFRHAPLPRMTNTFLVAGQDDPDEIVRGVARGLYAKSFGGGQVDIANGNFVFEVKEGYLIEDGRITAPVQGATLVGNGPDVLQKVTRVGHDHALDPGTYTCGKDGQSVPVNVGMPTVRIDGITVGGAGR